MQQLFNTRRLRNYGKSNIIEEIIKRRPKAKIKVVGLSSKINGARPTCVIFDDLNELD